MLSTHDLGVRGVDIRSKGISRKNNRNKLGLSCAKLSSGKVSCVARELTSKIPA